jgi:hypothetical protein
MFANMFNVLAKSFARSGSDVISPVRSRRTNRRYSFNEGIEGLEGRLAPSGGVATVTVTVTNQTDTSTQTDTGDGSDSDDGTPVVVYSTQPDTTAC